MQTHLTCCLIPFIIGSSVVTNISVCWQKIAFNLVHVVLIVESTSVQATGSEADMNDEGTIADLYL